MLIKYALRWLTAAASSKGHVGHGVINPGKLQTSNCYCRPKGLPIG